VYKLKQAEEIKICYEQKLRRLFKLQEYFSGLMQQATLKQSLIPINFSARKFLPAI